MPSGPRIRGNSAYGTTTDNPLTAGATTYNSAALPRLPVVSSAHAVVVLDPKRVFGEPEIVIVTAHAAAATVATITRAAYGTVARSHPAGTVWAHVPLDEDFIEVLTSSTRPTDPYRGQMIFETDTNMLVGRTVNDSWRPAVPFGLWETPSLTLTATTANPNLGASPIQETRFTRIGNTIFGTYRLRFGTGSTAGTGIYLIPLPVSAGVAVANIGKVIGGGYIFDASAGATSLTHVDMFLSTSGSVTTGRLFVYNNATEVSATFPWTWADNDQIVINYNYEASL